MTLDLPGSSRRKWTPQPPERCNPGCVAGHRHARDTGKWQDQRQLRRHRRTRGCRQPSTVDASQSGHYRLHPGDAQQEGGKVGLQLRERDDRTGNRGEHVLNQRVTSELAPPRDAHQEGLASTTSVNRRHRHRKPAPPHREPAPPHREPAPPHREPAPPPQEPAPPHREPAPPPSVAGATASGNRRHRMGNRRHHVGNRGDRIGTRGDEARVVRLVLGVRAARLVVLGVGAVLRLGPSSAFSRRWKIAGRKRWSPCAAEPLEPGSATATAPPAPISRHAASTQTPAAKRKCDRTTILLPTPMDRSPADQPLPHYHIARPSVIRESQTRYARSGQQRLPPGQCRKRAERLLRWG